jgi:hypothetical protein
MLKEEGSEKKIEEQAKRADIWRSVQISAGADGGGKDGPTVMPCQTQGPKQELNRRGQGTKARWNQ